MRTVLKILLSIVLLPWSFTASGQADIDPPVSPVFNLVSVQPLTGRTELHWSKSPSPDVSGYVLYNFRNNEGFAFDTIRDPNITDYINLGAFAGDRTESYVVAAIDTAGNTSPLSNELHTVFISGQIDTCHNRIYLTWNSYAPTPKSLLRYSIMASEDGSPYNVIGSVNPEITTFFTGSFKTGSQYCFIVRAEFSDGDLSSSNRICLLTKMQRPPDWINADQATVNDDNSISLSYTIDQLSEIKTFGLDRKKDTDPDFVRIAVTQTVGDKITYRDQSALPGQRYIYRLGAINNCGNPVVLSPVSVNILLTVSAEGGNVILNWNKYREWLGAVDHYKVFLNTGNGFSEKALLQPADTSIIFDYSDIMYDITAGTYCFRVEAYEGVNPYGIEGISRSNQACSAINEIITVPNAFTPDNDLINDTFRPVLSFAPLEYKLIITDRKNNQLFETTSYMAEWDGTRNGNSLPEDVYLWFLKVKTPSGNNVSRTGTVTIIKNR